MPQSPKWQEAEVRVNQAVRLPGSVLSLDESNSVELKERTEGGT